MPGVVGAKPSPCGAEWLARIAASEDVNTASKQVTWEGFKVRVNRCGSQQTVFHLLDQVGNGESFDLHISEDSMVDASKVKSSFDSSISAAETEDGR